MKRKKGPTAVNSEAMMIPENASQAAATTKDKKFFADEDLLQILHLQACFIEETLDSTEDEEYEEH